jgi:hypothetical protein
LTDLPGFAATSVRLAWQASRLTRRVATMRAVFTLTPNTTKRCAEVGFLLVVLSGIRFVASHLLLSLKLAKLRRTIACGALAVAGIPLNVATQWAQFGRIAP